MTRAYVKPIQVDALTRQILGLPRRAWQVMIQVAPGEPYREGPAFRTRREAREAFPGAS